MSSEIHVLPILVLNGLEPRQNYKDIVRSHWSKKGPISHPQIAITY